jgi:hypothetical protein
MLRLVIDDKEMSKEDTGQVRSGTGICFTNSDELQPIEVRTVEGPRHCQTPYPAGGEVDAEALLGGNWS